MAKSTKSVKKVEEKELTGVVDINANTSEKPIQTETDEVKLLKAQIEEMKKMMQAMQLNQSVAPSPSIVIKEDEKEVMIGCRMLQGIGLSTADGSIVIRLSFNEEQPVTMREMKLLLRRPSIKKLLEDGICYFKDNSDYEIFGIKVHKDLSDNAIISMLDTTNINEIIRELDKLTEDKRNSSVLNCIIYRICDMIRKNKLQSLDYYIRTGLEKYFDVEFNRGINTLNQLDNLKQ